MRFLFAALIVCSSAGVASAQCAGGGSADLLTIEEWSVSPSESSGIKGVDVAIRLRSNASKPFRLIDASIHFRDALGERISSIGLDRDTKAAPGETFSEEANYLGTQLDRIPNMERTDVMVFPCVRAVIYADGTKEEFK